MHERTALLAGAVVGAALGALTAFLVFTERGRTVRREIEPAIRDLAREAGRLQGAVEQIRGAASRSAEPPAWPRPHA